MSIFRQIIAVLVTFLFIAFTAFALVPILPIALLKLAFPIPRWQALCNRWVDWIASLWMDANDLQQSLVLPTKLDVEGLADLRQDEWYMMVANHQSWVDIVVLMRVFNHRIPYLKFFIKKSLIWVPLLGLAWWALEYPFMRRYTKAELARNPELKGKDIEETRKACEKFRHNPVTIVNFVEGTRFTDAKHAQQQSTYSNLLMPKAGGLAFTLAAMNGQLHSLLDVTIYYPDGRPSYWEYACGKVKAINIHVRQMPIPANMIGDYNNDAVFREGFQHWVNQIWREKEQQLQSMVVTR